jgi:mevalonate kinase
MHGTSEIFHAKILLFGEYSVIFNSMGLAVPYANYRGQLRFVDENQHGAGAFAMESNRQLELFADHLRGISGQKDDRAFDTDRLMNDIRKGLYFESSIPQGYGVGSSGALCAAIYHRYAFHTLLPDQIVAQKQAVPLRSLFSLMESHFHGQSSGLDPLLCYIRQPILIREDRQIEIVSLPYEQFHGKMAVFLIDTGISGKTGPLVNLFREKTRSEEYLSFIHHHLIPVTHACITSLLEGAVTEFFNYLKQLTEMQLERFREMIPAGFTKVWKTGLRTGDYYLKLCGSGGGGFLLGMSPDIVRASIRLQQYGISPVLVF